MFISILITVSLALGAYFLNIPKSLGAHPWWAQQVILYGAPAGLIVGLGVGQFFRAKWVMSSALLILSLVAFYVARQGGIDFAASYAEDAAAGNRWFFGWNATAFFFATFISYTSWR